jgi:hypothetical protein
MVTVLVVAALGYLIYKIHRVEKNNEIAALCGAALSCQVAKSTEVLIEQQCAVGERVLDELKVEAAIIRRYLGGLIENDLLPHVGFVRPTNYVKGDEVFYQAWREEVLDKLDGNSDEEIVTTPETQGTESPNTAQFFYPRNDGPFCTFRRRLREAVCHVRHRLSLLHVSWQEIRREFCNFLRRTQTLLTTKRHYYTGSFGPDLGSSGGLDASGHPVSCTRTLGRIRDTQSFVQSKPEATSTEVDLFLVGWDRGAEWGASHEHLCIPGSCSRYAELACRHLSNSPQSDASSTRCIQAK